MCAGHKAPNCNSHSTLWRKPTDGVQSKCSGTLQAHDVSPFIDVGRGISGPKWSFSGATEMVIVQARGRRWGRVGGDRGGGAKYVPR